MQNFKFFSENKILNLPTARWFCIKFDTDSWSEIIGFKTNLLYKQYKQ